MNKVLPWIALSGLALIIAFGCTGATPSSAEGAISSGPFGRVQAVFNANCTKCHSGSRPKGRLDLTSYESVIRGGKTGTVVVPKDPGNSVIIQALRATNRRRPMPANSPPLPEAQIKVIEDWISSGAGPDK